MLDQTNELLIDGKDGFKNIFQQFFQPLYYLSSQYLEDHDEAKEVVQEAFVKLWEIRQNLYEDSNIRNFLFTLVKNNCLNLLKRKQLLLKHHEKLRWMEMHYQYESLSRMGSDYLEFNELREKIDLAIKFKLLRGEVFLFVQSQQVFQYRRRKNPLIFEILDGQHCFQAGVSRFLLIMASSD